LPSALQLPHISTLSPGTPLKVALTLTITLPLLLVTTSALLGAPKPLSPGSNAS
jgi:hypothetical protein